MAAESGYLGRIRRRIRTDRALRNRLRAVIGIGGLGLTLFWLLVPVLWAFKTSLQTQAAAGGFPPVFWVHEPQWGNYLTVVQEQNLHIFMWNGFVVATISTIASMLLAVPHAYAVSVYDYKLRRFSFFAILAARIIPPISIAVPFFIMFQRLGIVDTKFGIVIVFTFLFEPFAVWIIKGFIDGLPHSLIGAARIDGCSKFQAFYKIMLPLCVPAIVSAVIITWIIAWNEFTLVFILTLSEQAQTLPVAILLLIDDNLIPWNLMAAGSMIGAIPSITIVIIFQRHLRRGLVDLRV